MYFFTEVITKILDNENKTRFDIARIQNNKTYNFHKKETEYQFDDATFSEFSRIISESSP